MIPTVAVRGRDLLSLGANVVTQHLRFCIKMGAEIGALDQEQPQSTGGNGNLHKNAGNPVFGPSARRAAVRTPPDTLDSDLSVAEICYPWALMW